MRDAESVWCDYCADIVEDRWCLHLWWPLPPRAAELLAGRHLESHHFCHREHLLAWLVDEEFQSLADREE